MRVALLLLAVLLSAASTRGTAPPPNWISVDRGILSTGGVVIEADDGAFRLVPGGEFKTPFWAYDCPAQPTAQNYQLGLRLGARRVKIHHPAAGGRPLHGVLAFCRVSPATRGPVSRSYNLEIPDERVYETTGGRVSMQAESTGVTKPYSDGEANLPAWILWISEQPL
jgi:hypothetical protein